jgi:hypothetical protein
LDHEVLDHTVEDQVVVVLVPRVRHEILHLQKTRKVATYLHYSAQELNLATAVEPHSHPPPYRLGTLSREKHKVDITVAGVQDATAASLRLECSGRFVHNLRAIQKSDG